MFDLANFSLRDMTECSIGLRKVGAGAASMEEVAQRLVRFLYESLADVRTGEKACVLVRFFQTCPYALLPSELRQSARTLLDADSPSPEMKCLTLLATAGTEPAWNSRHSSAGHRAIPLASEQLVAQVPMISNLIRQFGLEIKTVLRPDPALLVDLSQKSYNVFHVPEALGSPYVPAQPQFVVPFGVRSVLGIGGMLSSGNLFVVILFSRVPIPAKTADLFKTLALSVKVAVEPFAVGAIFAETANRSGSGADG